MKLELDHIAVAGESLEEAVAHAEAAVGMPLLPGGEHPRYGTHNQLLGLGRGLYLEAIAIDPRTGIVYETEDYDAGLFYRFLPDQPGALARGGRLQALVLSDRAAGDTRNWSDADRIADAEALPVHWVDLEDVTAPDGDLAQRGHAAGAALFARGEGMAWAAEGEAGSVYFACTSGGPARCGQI